METQQRNLTKNKSDLFKKSKQSTTSSTSSMHDASQHPLQGAFANPAQSFSSSQIMQLQKSIGNLATIQYLKSQLQSAQPVQKKANKTGLPDSLKSGMESLSGLSLDDVNVHYNSSKPAQMQAHAYAQGTDIHVAPGQEKHLAHEAWHVVQQKQNRVKPTLQSKGMPINTETHLEREADLMGAKAERQGGQQTSKSNEQSPAQASLASSSSGVIQGNFIVAVLGGVGIGVTEKVLMEQGKAHALQNLEKALNAYEGEFMLAIEKALQSPEVKKQLSSLLRMQGLKNVAMQMVEPLCTKALEQIQGQLAKLKEMIPDLPDNLITNPFPNLTEKLRGALENQWLQEVYAASKSAFNSAISAYAGYHLNQYISGQILFRGTKMIKDAGKTAAQDLLSDKHIKDAIDLHKQWENYNIPFPPFLAYTPLGIARKAGKKIGKYGYDKLKGSSPELPSSESISNQLHEKSDNAINGQLVKINQKLSEKGIEESTIDQALKFIKLLNVFLNVVDKDNTKDKIKVLVQAPVSALCGILGKTAVGLLPGKIASMGSASSVISSASSSFLERLLEKPIDYLSEQLAGPVDRGASYLTSIPYLGKGIQKGYQTLMTGGRGINAGLSYAKTTLTGNNEEWEQQRNKFITSKNELFGIEEPQEKPNSNSMQPEESSDVQDSHDVQKSDVQHHGSEEESSIRIQLDLSKADQVFADIVLNQKSDQDDISHGSESRQSQERQALNQSLNQQGNKPPELDLGLD